MPIPTSASNRPLAVITGASSGIGLELAKLAAKEGYALLLAADTPFDDALLQLQGSEVQTVSTDLSTREGIDELDAAIGGRPVDVLCANAGHGLGHAFLDQDFAEARHVVDTNITGTIDLIQRVGRTMRARKAGNILITGSIAGLMPGTYQAVYNATKAFMDSFSEALRYELKDSGVNVTCLLPGATATEFFARADLLDTKVGTDKKQPASEVAEIGWEAMKSGDAHVVAGLKNKLQAMLLNVMPTQAAAGMHASMAEPGSAAKQR